MRLKMLSKYNSNPYLRLAVDSKMVRFSCPGLDKNEIEPAALFDDFLLALAKEKILLYIHIGCLKLVNW